MFRLRVAYKSDMGIKYAPGEMGYAVPTNVFGACGFVVILCRVVMAQ